MLRSPKDIACRFSRHFARHTVLALLAIALLLPYCVSAAGDQSEYLPLAVGNKWVLRSPAAKDAIVFEVIGEHNGSFDIRFDNPWIPSILRIRPMAQSYFLESVTVNGQAKTMPPGTIYWDFSARRGQVWENAIGKLDLMSREQHVNGRQRTFDKCIEFQE